VVAEGLSRSRGVQTAAFSFAGEVGILRIKVSIFEPTIRLRKESERRSTRRAVPLCLVPPSEGATVVQWVRLHFFESFRVQPSGMLIFSGCYPLLDACAKRVRGGCFAR
jgi:hypothetical protein